MPYDLYPAVDSAYNFPPLVRAALAASTELRNTVLALTTTQRNNLAGAELWDGRTIVNTTTDRINRYDLGTTTWIQVADSSEITALDTQRQLNLGLRNRIRNGDFGVNQRGAVITLGAAAGAYGIDGWMIWSSGAVANQQSSVFAPGSFPDLKNFGAFGLTTPASAAADYAFVSTRIEDVTQLAGQQVTLSFYAGGNVAGRTIGLSLRQYFGSGGSAQFDSVIGSQLLTGTVTKYSVTFTMPSVSGKTIAGGNDYLEIRFWLGTGSTNLSQSGMTSGQGTQAAWTLNLTGVQLELGPIATPFERLPQQMQLAWCQRYYFRETPGIISGPFRCCPLAQSYSTSGVVFTFSWPVDMRVAPTWLFQAGAATFIQVGNPGGASVNVTFTVVPAQTTKTAGYAQGGGGSGLIAGGACGVSTNAVNGNTSFIEASAEL